MARRKNKRNRVVLVIDPQTMVLDKLPVQDAIEKIIKGKAFGTEFADGEFFYGPPNELGLRRADPVPVSICLTKSVHKPKPVFNEVMAGRRQILDRDNFTCAYCGNSGTTIDHIHPASRGGENTWLNLITACESCNQLKADYTLEEIARMSVEELYNANMIDRTVFSREEILASTKEDLNDAGLITHFKLKWQPYIPDPNKHSKEQLEVWRKIADGVIDIPDDLE